VTGTLWERQRSRRKTALPAGIGDDYGTGLTVPPAGRAEAPSNQAQSVTVGADGEPIIVADLVHRITSSHHTRWLIQVCRSMGALFLIAW
jgi:hypothetical protein